MTANIPKLLRLIALCLALAPALNAQPLEEVLSCLPYEMRPVRAMDITAELKPRIVMAGEGVVRTIPGGPLVELCERYRGANFTHVAIASDRIALMRTALGDIVAADIIDRREVSIDNLPSTGRSLLRCNEHVVIPIDNALLRCTLRDGVLRVDTLALDGFTPNLSSAADGEHCTLIDTALRELRVINIITGATTWRRGLTTVNVPVFLQALSTRLSLIISYGLGSVIAVWNDRDSTQTLDTFTQYPIAPVIASRYGGGAAIYNADLISAINDTLRIVKSYSPVVYRTTVTAGVAWWHASAAQPRWYFTGHGVSLARIEPDGTTPTDSDSYQFARVLKTSTRTWSHTAAAGSTLVLAASCSPSATSYSAFTMLLVSRDHGSTWITRDIPLQGSLNSLTTDSNARILLATRDTVIMLDGPFAQARIMTTSTQLGSSITCASLTPSELIVLADSVHVRSHSSDQWQVRTSPTYSRGFRVLLLRGDTIAVQPRLTVDGGSTWKFIQTNDMSSASSFVLNTDTTYASTTINGIFTSTGGYISPNYTAELLRLDDNTIFYALERRARRVDIIRGTIDDRDVLTLNPYAGVSSWIYYPPPPRRVFDNANGIGYIIAGSMMKRITQMPTTSVGDTPPQQDQRIWPQPASTVLHGLSGTVDVHTLTGAHITTYEPDASGSIDVSRLTPGLYILSSQTASQKQSMLVVIQR
jgi:hypothetical protein